MTDLETIVPKEERSVRKADPAAVAASPSSAAEDHRQRGLMAGSLFLLLLALSIVLWHERTFWFLNTREAEASQPLENSPVIKGEQVQPSAALAHSAKPAHARQQVSTRGALPAVDEVAPPGAVVSARTVLPPLE